MKSALAFPLFWYILVLLGSFPGLLSPGSWVTAYLFVKTRPVYGILTTSAEV